MHPQAAHRLEVLLGHLLKWQFQPAARSNSWRATIRERRQRIARMIAESPSLASYPAAEMASAYVMGLNLAMTDTSLPEATFPAECPYTAEQALDDDFWPGPRAV